MTRRVLRVATDRGWFQLTIGSLGTRWLTWCMLVFTSPFVGGLNAASLGSSAATRLGESTTRADVAEDLRPEAFQLTDYLFPKDAIDVASRRRVAFEISSLNVPGSVEAVLRLESVAARVFGRMIADPDEIVRFYAAKALAKRRPVCALALIEHQLRCEPDADVLVALLRTAYLLKPSFTVAASLREYCGGSAQRKRWLACALGQLVLPDSVLLLIELLGDPSWAVRRNAYFSLTALSSRMCVGVVPRPDVALEGKSKTLSREGAPLSGGDERQIELLHGLPGSDCFTFSRFGAYPRFTGVLFGQSWPQGLRSGAILLNIDGVSAREPEGDEPSSWTWRSSGTMMDLTVLDGSKIVRCRFSTPGAPRPGEPVRR